MPLDVFFRTAEEMPELELIALDLCRGRILDIGAGAGSHALLLQQKHQDVTALDLSAGAVDVMQQRGVKKVLKGDIKNHSDERYDTLLLLMNGIGLTGNLEGFKDFLSHASTLLKEGGQLLFDSSDIAYLYEDSSMPANKYYGQVSYQYIYKGQQGEWFNWLYLDQETLKATATACDWSCEILFDDGEDQYLARLFPPRSLQC
jgi:cyclopropane fatty-acyl-phospholipid synthase-like methyltransferase